MTETQQRFLRAIAERVPSEQVVEVHLFPAIRQGGVETGVAVVAEDPRRAPVGADFEVTEPGLDVAIDGPGVTEAMAAEESDVVTDSSDEPVAESEADASATEGAASPTISRYIIHTARYRLTLKGVDRGKWEVDVVAEADAPLDAVDAVVRGVQRRAGDVDDPTRMTGEEIRSALPAAV